MSAGILLMMHEFHHALAPPGRGYDTGAKAGILDTTRSWARWAELGEKARTELKLQEPRRTEISHLEKPRPV